MKTFRTSVVDKGGRMPKSRSLEAAVQEMRLMRLLSEVNALSRIFVTGRMRGLVMGSASSVLASGSGIVGVRSEGCVIITSVRTWITISLRASCPFVKQWKKRSRLLSARSWEGC